MGSALYLVFKRILRLPYWGFCKGIRGRVRGRPVRNGPTTRGRLPAAGMIARPWRLRLRETFRWTFLRIRSDAAQSRARIRFRITEKPWRRTGLQARGHARRMIMRGAGGWRVKSSGLAGGGHTAPASRGGESACTDQPRAPHYAKALKLLTQGPRLFGRTPLPCAAKVACATLRLLCGWWADAGRWEDFPHVSRNGVGG